LDPYSSGVAIRTTGIRQPGIWASIVSERAPVLRAWLLPMGFTQDLLIPGRTDDAIHHCQLDGPVVHELVAQTDYPSRDFTVADPDGNHWTFATFAG